MGQMQGPLREAPAEVDADEAAFRGIAGSSRRTPTVLAAGAAVVVLVALVTRMASPDVVSPTEPHIPEPSIPQPSPAAAVESPNAEAITIAQPPQLVLPSQNAEATPRPSASADAAVPGLAALVPAGDPETRLTVELSEGWQTAGDSMYLRTDAEGSHLASISAWKIEGIHVFPCRWSAGRLASQPLMRTAPGQAQALSSWWGQDAGIPYSNSTLAPLATPPVELDFAGRTAWYTSVLITRGFDLTECDGGQLILWEAGDHVRTALPGELHELYIVAIEGDVIVIDSTSTPALSAEGLQELERVVDSIRLAA